MIVAMKLRIVSYWSIFNFFNIVITALHFLHLKSFSFLSEFIGVLVFIILNNHIRLNFFLQEKKKKIYLPTEVWILFQFPTKSDLTQGSFYNTWPLQKNAWDASDAKQVIARGRGSLGPGNWF